MALESRKFPAARKRRKRKCWPLFENMPSPQCLRSTLKLSTDQFHESTPRKNTPPQKRCLNCHCIRRFEKLTLNNRYRSKCVSTEHLKKTRPNDDKFINKENGQRDFPALGRRMGFFWDVDIVVRARKKCVRAF